MLVLNLSEKVFTEIFNNVSFSEIHSNKMLPPNCLKTFSYRCFSRLVLLVCNIRFTQLIFNDHMNFSISIILSPPFHNQMLIFPA